MKKLFFMLFIMVALGSLFASNLLTDDFTGTAGTLLTANGWSAFSGNGTTPMSVAAPGLTYTGYAGSGIGNATSVSGNGEDVYKPFTAPTSGSIYYSFMVNSAITNNTTGYAIMLYQNTSTFFGKFWLVNNAGSVNFGLTKATSTVASIAYAGGATPTAYSQGTTHLIVIKYTFNTGTTTDDAVYMWVDPVLGGAEPTPTVSIPAEGGTDASSILGIAIRQYNAATLTRFDGFCVGTTWADVSPATSSAPTVTTTDLSSIEATTASGGGNVTADGGSSIIDRGVCWATSADPVSTGLHYSNGAGSTGAFTSPLASLTAGQLYHVRAYAQNSTGIAYGADKTFTTLATEPGTQPTILSFGSVGSASFTVSFTAAGGTPAGYLAIRKTGSAPTGTPVDATAYSVNDAIGDGTVVFNGTTASLPFSQTGLSPSTTYYYAIYSYNGSGVSANYYLTGPLSGSQATTSGIALPSVTTAAITSISDIAAAGGGEVTNNGGEALSARGVCWGTATGPVVTGSHTSDGTAVSAFTSSLTGLTANTPYFVRAYATNSAGPGYGNEVTFTTLKTEPAAHVTVFAAGTPTLTAIPLTWVDVVGGEKYLVKGSSVSYDAITAPTDGVAEADGALVKNVNQLAQTYTFTGLTPSTTYYFKIFPYTNNATGNNYKTDGTVPTASAITTAYSPSFLLEENFVYTAGTYLNANGYGIQSAGANPPTVSVTDLSYSAYPSSGGGSASLGSAGGEDVNKTYAAQTYGDVYCSFLVNVSVAKTSGDYFFHFGPNPMGTEFRGRVYAKLNGTSVNFGFGKNTEAATYDTTPIAYGATTLIVLKYTLVDGAANDQAMMWINPAIGAAPPAATITAASSGTDASAIGSFGLRQGSSSNSPAALVDGVRVANTWALLFPGYAPGINTIGTLNPFTAIAGSYSDTQQYTVSGTLLTADIHVAAPTGFEVSLNGSTWASSVNVPQSGGTASSTVYVRLNSATPQYYAPANIVHTSEGATTVNKSVTGTAYLGEIVVTGAINAFTNGVVGYPSAPQTYHVNSTSFTNYVNLTATGPFQIRDTSHSPTWETTLQLSYEFDGDIDVRYNPIVAGTQTGTISHVAEDGEAATVVINLSGTATDPTPVVTVLPATMSFSVGAGNTSDAQTCAVTSAYLTLPIDIASTGAYTFSTSLTGTYSNPLQVAATFNNNIYIKFAPLTQGTFTNTITFTSGTHSDLIDVTGYGLDPNATYASDLFISEYLEGASFDKGLEIYNGTGHAVNLSTYRLAQYNNGAAAVGSFTLALGDINLNNGSCYTIVNSQSTNTALIALASLVSASSVLSFNGDDAIALQKSSDGTNWTQVDIFGRIGDRPTPPGYWTAEVGYKTQDETLVRKASVYNGITVSPTGTGPTAFTTLGTEWDWYAIGTISNFGIHTFYPGATAAVAPTILPAAGVKNAPITVTMSTTTTGGQIRYTTNGTDPTDTSTLYTTGFQVSATTTVKARTYATGYAPSSISSALYIYPTSVGNIAALRASATDTGVYYKIAGEVVLTLKSPAYYNSKYIQDATGAIYIYDSLGKITTSYNLGDGITGIVAQLQTYQGMLEMIPTADPGAATSTGNVITPQVITLSQLSSHQAELVTINGVSFSSEGTFTLATNYTVQDASGLGIIRAQYSDLDYMGTALPTSSKNITGVVLQRTLLETVFIPRSLADIADGAAPDAPVNIIVTVSGNDIVLTWTDDPTVTSWKVWASDTSPTTGFGTEPVATVTSSTCTLTNEGNTFGKRFYKIYAVR